MGRPVSLKITYEMLIALLQGKELHFTVPLESHTVLQEFVIVPPFDGVFMTYEELSRIRYDSEMGVVEFMERLRRRD